MAFLTQNISEFDAVERVYYSHSNYVNNLLQLYDKLRDLADDADRAYWQLLEVQLKVAKIKRDMGIVQCLFNRYARVCTGKTVKLTDSIKYVPYNEEPEI